MRGRGKKTKKYFQPDYAVLRMLKRKSVAEVAASTGISKNVLRMMRNRGTPRTASAVTANKRQKNSLTDVKMRKMGSQKLRELLFERGRQIREEGWWETPGVELPEDAEPIWHPPWGRFENDESPESIRQDLQDFQDKNYFL